MKTSQRFVTIILIFKTTLAIAQGTKANTIMKEIEHKKKEELVQMAYDLIREKQPDLILNPFDFEITTWKNSREVLVKFRRIIKYYPLKATTDKPIDFDLVINLINHKILPFDNLISSAFYIPTEADNAAVSFIKDKFGFFSSHFENTIREGEEDYFIDCENEYSFGKYILNKKTGELGPALQGSYIPVPFQIEQPEGIDVLIEIKD